MSEKRQFRAIKGTRDILPPDSALWNWVEQSARETFERYGFHDIRTPIFEETDLFARAVGTDTDVVSKEMYTFPDNWQSELAGLQHYLVTIRPSFAPRLCDAYLTILEEFITLASHLTSSGEIPRATYNDATLEDLQGILARLDQIRAEPEAYAAQTGGAAEEWRTALEPVHFAVDLMVLGDDISLRPEGTASVCRAYIENGMHTLPGNVKLYYAGPMFRRERPQKGRYRQFYQIGAEVLGQSDAPAIDAEVIEMLLAFFARIGLANTVLSINSIGDKNCRPQYGELLRAELQKVKDQLGPDSQRRIETNPLRVLDSKLPEEQPIIEKLPRISGHLCDECRVHFTKLKSELDLRGIAYQENWRLVRGLDYYTRTTFEVTAAGLGSQNAVCGGGRYDGLVELLGGPPTKGIGFAIGTDRAILSIQEGGHAPKLRGLDVFTAWMGTEAYPAAVAIVQKLRAAGFSVELPPEEMKFKKSLGLADKLGARYALILGGDEVASRTFTLKRLSDANQQKLSEADLIRHLNEEKWPADGAQ